MKCFFKKYGLWLIGAFVVPLLISYFWFAFDGCIPSGEIDKRDWLAFWAGFLAFYGAVFLGLIAIWQNEQASRATKEANNISKNLARIQIARDVMDKLVIINLKDTQDNIPSKHYYLNNNIEDVPRSSRHEDYFCFFIENKSANVLCRFQICYEEKLLFDTEISVMPDESKDCVIMFTGILHELKCKEFIIVFNGLYDVKSYASCKFKQQNNQISECLKLETYNFKGYKGVE